MTSSLRTTLPTLFALLLGYALMQAGNTLQGNLLSVRGSLEHFSPTQIGAGVAMSAFGRPGLLYVIILAQALMALWGAYRSLQRASPEAKEHFVPEPMIPVGTDLAPVHGQAR